MSLLKNKQSLNLCINFLLKSSCVLTTYMPKIRHINYIPGSNNLVRDFLFTIYLYPVL